ncbi:hypothetical protein [Bradyrhizobium sp. Leo170]|uniref:hypothetical protein n=1 Tax=Bradyrhizobium sp. Leo170 TaxID=1571199 RepID=UPI00102E94F9|nr:hypothetical protein [Bradyrhizobium sp. Leo170]TAI59750.1 hypothetical protein CWO89_44550 [Bradyrhizobium sp. Leo170]
MADYIEALQKQLQQQYTKARHAHVRLRTSTGRARRLWTHPPLASHFVSYMAGSVPRTRS